MSNYLAFVRQIIASAAITLGLAGAAQASISQIVAFGDSLSDTGNLYQLTADSTGMGGVPGSPYYNGRFSDGLLAVEAMAYQLNVGVTSYAYGGAQTGTGNQVNFLFPNTGVANQIQQYTTQLGGALPAPNTLFFVWAGPNNFYTGNNMLSPATSQTASANLIDDLRTLFDAGARNFFVPLMPDLSTTPDALQSSDAYREAAHDRTTEFNDLLQTGISQLTQTLPGFNAIVFDTPAFMAQTLPSLQQQGFNTTDACYNARAGTVCPDEEKYVFWDSVHPSAATDWLLGQAFVAATAVPEPGTLLLMLLGLSTLIMLNRLQAEAKRRTAMSTRYAHAHSASQPQHR